MRHARAIFALLFAATVITAFACADGNRNVTADETTPAKTIPVANAEARLKRIVLDASDVGDGYTQDVARTQTNEQAAEARPDTTAARRQYAAWGQVLAYNVQFAAPEGAAPLYSGKLARVMNTATLFDSADGASTGMQYVKALSEPLLADLLTYEGRGTTISDTHVTKDLAFDAGGDESFAWRVDGKATTEGGATVSFIADTVFVRVKNVVGAVTCVALGKAPDRADVARLVSRFVERARAA